MIVWEVNLSQLSLIRSLIDHRVETRLVIKASPLLME